MKKKKRRVPIPHELKKFIYFLYNRQCAICQHTHTKKNPLGIHHKDHDPSNNVATNLMLLCRKCHMILHQKEKRR